MTIEVTPKGTRGMSVPRWLMALFGPMMRFSIRRYRRNGGVMEMNGQPVALLSTVGSKSGQRRQVLINRFPDGDSTNSWLVTGTKGGSAMHPAWFINLARHPDQVSVEIEGREVRVIPESLRGAEREAAWRRIAELAPSFGGYPEKTDRVIPVVRLTRADDPA